MKIFIDWLKKAITKIEHDSELYVGNQFSNKFDVYFFNVGTDTDWFPTLTQLAPNGRETGPFSADSDSFTTTTIDDVTYVTATFTMGTGYAFMKGVSSFFLYENRITTPHPTKSVIGKFIVTLNNSDNGYFIDDPEFNPKVKEYVDKYSQLRFGGEASTSVIEALTSNQGVWLATDTGYYWYWDYDNNEYVRGNLFQAVSVADGAITNAKIANGAVTEDKIASAVKNRINNSVQKGENNPTAASIVRTIISNSNSQEEDVDSSYGSNVVLALDEAEVEHSYYSGGTTKYSGIKFDEYHDTANEDYPRAVIETGYSENATPENSKITILKDLIELLSGGKIEIKKGNSYYRILKNPNNKDNVEIFSNNVVIDGLDWAHIGTDSYEINVVDGVGFNLIYVNDQLFLCDTTGFKSNVPFYYNNKELSTKEYVLQREAYLQQQIDDIEIQTNVVKQSDIADNLTTDNPSKVLSAAQGVVLKHLIDNINTILQSDDTTLDQLQEIVDYIKNNKSLIDGITTSKVSVSDIINNLTSTATNKPLSAYQGKVLKDTLDSVQASISALTTNKQDKIDSSHKLDADLVAENSSRVFVTPTQKQQIGTNTSDISSLTQRVTTLEENPTSNVSGTNDGTNWTSITIGNDTYAIPSGSSSGGSGSGETLKIIEFNDVFPAPLRIGINSTKLNEFFTAMSQSMGITIDESNLSLIWANASDYEKLSALYYLSAYSLFSNYDGFMVSTYRPTTVEVDGQTVVTLIYLIVIDATEQITTFNNNQDISSSTISITTIGGGNGGASSGGSSSSESYYKIVLEDGSMKLNCIIYKDDLATMLNAINTQMGTSLATPQDLINLYDTMKGNSNYTATLVGLFTALGSYSCDSNLNCVVEKSQIDKYKITGYGENGLLYTTNDGPHDLFLSSESYYIGFTSSSTLTITEVTNQKI